MEFTSKASTIDAPFYLYDPVTDTAHARYLHSFLVEVGLPDVLRRNRIDGNGVLIQAIDNLPTELAREATNHFGNSLTPWIREMVIRARSLPHIRPDRRLTPLGLCGSYCQL